MATCTVCGGNVSEGNFFCTQCGAPVSETNGADNNSGYSYNEPRSQGGYSSAEPAYVYTNAPKEDRVLSMGAFIASVLLMSIPFAGFILQIVWACGATNSLNRRNLARAYLVLSIISVVLAVLLGIAFAASYQAIIKNYHRFFLF